MPAGGLLWFCAALFPAAAQRIITTVAGTDITPVASGSTATQVPITVTSVASDAAGNVYIVDEFQSVALRVNTDGQIAVIAGNGFQTYSGDGGPATMASLNGPNGIAVDSAGNVYIGDTYNDRIRKIDTRGVMSTIAGNGQPGFSGDGGLAVEALVRQPSQMFVDSTGNLYFSDFGNSRIRKIDTAGIITTVAGNGQTKFAGDGGPATSASLNLAEAAALDSQGRLVIADTFNYRIRRVALDGTITTIAGTGDPNVLRPYGLTADKAGNVYFSDVPNNLIKRIDAGGNLTVFAGTGASGYNGENVPAAKVALNYPSSLAMDPAGALLYADEFGNRIRRISNGFASSVAGNGLQVITQNGAAALVTVMNRPYGLSFDRTGNMYIADTFNGLVRLVNTKGIMTTIAGTGILGFSGDGGPATSAQMNQPMMTAEDTAGNVYVSDNQSNRIRRIATNGTISTYVNAIGQTGYNGDNIAAGQASLNNPNGIVFDSAGNLLIADTLNNRIRRVSPSGTITTVAGNGQGAYAGDNGPATSASLNAPLDVSVDAAGNILIADTGNQRIRRVDAKSGIITTIAGGNQPGFSGDGGPAASALLNAPESVSADSAGNIFIADRGNFRIREVSNGIISTFAGNGVSGYRGDGGPATAASLVQPDRVVVDAANNVYIADSKSNRIRVVLATAPSVQVSTSNVTLSAPSDGAVTAPQRIALSSPIIGLQYSTTVSTQDGATWLLVSSDAAAMPANLSVQADPTGMAPGTYHGTVLVQPVAGSVQLVQVTFNVAAAQGPVLAVSAQQVTFGLIQGTSPSTNVVSVKNEGGGTLSFSYSASAAQGQWLTATAPPAASASPNNPANITVVADPRGLAPGTYPGTLVVTGAGQTQNVNVTLTVSPTATKALLSQAALSFRAAQGGGTPMPLSFGILNVGQGQMNWTASAAPLNPAESWLSIDSTSGTVATPFTDVSLVTVSVNPAGLAPNVYYGRVRVSTAGNTTQSVTVVLTVVPADLPLEPQVSPAGLVFTGLAGSSPGSQTISIGNLGAGSITYTSSGFTSDGQVWFAEAPSNGVVSPNQPQNIAVQPDFSVLSPGTHQGAISIQFGDGSVQIVQVLAVVGGAASVQAASSLHHAVRELSSGTCTPSQLNIVPTSTQANFTGIVGQPVQIAVNITDDCSNPVTNSSGAFVSFYNGTGSANMTWQQGGTWTASWQPAAAGSVRLSVSAFDVLSTGRTLANELFLQAQISASSGPAAAVANAVENGASFVANVPVSPGSLVSIFGINFTDGSSQSFSGTPVATALNSVQVQLGDSLLPVFYAGPNQLNLQIPFDVPVNTQHQLLIQRGSTLSVPMNLTVAPAQPGIFTTNEGGTGQGAITNAITYVLADSSNPVRANDFISIYCTGLGPVNPAVAPGSLAPSTPLSYSSPVSVLIGNVPAQVIFAGLAPGEIGLYQVNAIVPAEVTPGPAVPVVIQMANQTSPPATIAVGN